jgi:Fic family protein
VTAILPSTPLLLYMYVRKEAMSSQIEGTQSDPTSLGQGRQQAARGVPAITKLDRRHASRQRAVRPPPPNRLNECLDAFEKFLHLDDPRLPPFIKARLAHVQFEAIHPFLDGNGRLGRLLITLMLCDAGVLGEPNLYLSLYVDALITIVCCRRSVRMALGK